MKRRKNGRTNPSNPAQIMNRVKSKATAQPSFFQRFSALQIALGVSVAAHAALLTVRFVNPEAYNRVFQDTPLEVILVNARSDEKPDKALAIAQASLAGGGELDKGRATSPLPPALRARVGDAIEEDQQRVEQLKEQQQKILAQVRKQLANMPEPDLQAVTPNQATVEQEEKRQALVKILAEIEKRIQEENARPKKRYISPATREEVYAVYYDALRRKIEERGTQDFPVADGKKLYGDLTMVITVNHNGDVLQTEVVQPSGTVQLDRRAQAIVRSLTFGDFNERMRRQADEIVVISRFRFTRDQGLQTQMSGQ